MLELEFAASEGERGESAWLCSRIHKTCVFSLEFGAVHEPDNPEYSILKQRLARRLKANGVNESGIKDLTIVGLTQVNKLVEVILLSAYLLPGHRQCKRAFMWASAWIPLSVWSAHLHGTFPRPCLLSRCSCPRKVPFWECLRCAQNYTACIPRILCLWGGQQLMSN